MRPTTLPKDFTQALRGILSLFIIGTHLSGALRGGEEATLWLRLCNLVTPLALSFFFFFSGYGLMRQLLTQGAAKAGLSGKELWSGWLPRRVWALLKPFLFFFALGLIVVFFGEGYAGGEWSAYGARVLFYLSRWRYGSLGPPSTSWFLGELLLLYVAFFVAYRFSASRRWGTVVLLGEILLLMWFAYEAYFGRYWLRYPLTFWLGAVYARYEGRLLGWVQARQWLAWLLLALAGGLYLYGVPRVLAWERSSWLLTGLFYGGLYLLSLLLLLQSAALGLTRAFVARRTSWWARGLLWLGDISLEIYLLHMLLVNLFRSKLCYLSDVWLYTVLVYAGTLLGAYLLARYARRLVRS